MNSLIKGKIFFVGAGPGDPSLLTVKAAKILSKADVVITDRLVSSEIISEYVNSAAHIIPVGKQGGSSASKSQHWISALLVQMAQKFSIVVRLKGGDVSLFSNILDELETIIAAGIPYEIIPGITAASGAAAYTGIPLTARNYATGVRILTYYADSAINDNAWKELARFDDTLVFYMTGKSLKHAVYKLLEAGADADTPFVVVEQATTPNQHVHQFILEDFLYNHHDTNFISPSLVIIGKVAALYEQFAWLPNNSNRSPFFKSLREFTGPTSLLTSIQNIFHVSRV